MMTPNETHFDAMVEQITELKDGAGAEAEVRVLGGIKSGKSGDFVGARAGGVLNIFVAVPDMLKAGASYRFSVMQRGGPEGERVVLKTAKPLKG